MPPPFDLIAPLLPGLLITVEVAVAASLFALAMSVVAEALRRSPVPPLRWLAQTYVTVFRGTSALVQLFWVYFALPMLGVRVSAFAAGVLVLGLNTGAYGAEVLRGAIGAVPKGQWEAARSLHLTPLTTLRRVILPQALTRAIPPFGNLAIELLKNTALVSMVTLADLTFRAQELRATTLRTVEIFSLVLLFYFAVALVITTGIRRLEGRVARWSEGTR